MKIETDYLIEQADIHLELIKYLWSLTEKDYKKIQKNPKKLPDKFKKTLVNLDYDLREAQARVEESYCIYKQLMDKFKGEIK